MLMLSIKKAERIPIKQKRAIRRVYQSRYLLLLFLPVLVYYIIFEYAPMFGLVVAFKNLNMFKGFWASEWVGLKYFRIFLFENPDFLPLLRNTFLLGFYSLIFGFPAPILLALMLNEIKSVKFKRLTQTISYLPHFISNVIVCSMIIMFLSPDNGLVNNILENMGLEKIYFMGRPEYFRTIYIVSGIWKGIGWGSIIYLAAITNIDPNLYEAAEIDGAGRWRKMWHITIVGIMPIIVILLILDIGGLLSTGFEKVILLYNPAIYSTADIISTYTYRVGIQQANFSYATAIGLFNGIVGFTLISIANYTSRRLMETSLW